MLELVPMLIPTLEEIPDPPKGHSHCAQIRRLGLEKHPTGDEKPSNSCTNTHYLHPELEKIRLCSAIQKKIAHKVPLIR